MTLPRPIITLFPHPDGWRARFHDDPQIMELFDSTDTLPTAFTLLESGEHVRRSIQNLNPGHRIRWVDREGDLHDPEV